MSVNLGSMSLFGQPLDKVWVQPYRDVDVGLNTFKVGDDFEALLEDNLVVPLNFWYT